MLVCGAKLHFSFYSWPFQTKGFPLELLKSITYSSFRTVFNFFRPVFVVYLHRNMAGLYIHIPFCQKRCIYCDFYSTVRLPLRAAYIEALCREIALRAGYLHGEPIGTIYLGGGTPSLLSTEQLLHILQTAERNLTIDADAEITIEVNPDDVTEAFARDLSSLPINRVSMGIQTFDNSMLHLIGRRHTAEQAVIAFHRLREAGIQNISLDLIYGLPGQSLHAWERDIDTVLRLAPEHLSAYALIYEAGTPLWQLRQQGRVKETDEELSLNMFTRLMDKTRDAGYEHYEISNFALPGKHSRHNSSYWRDVPYLGCGPSAHSFDGKSRQWNKSSLSAYIAAKGDTSGELSEREELTFAMRHNEALLKRLRTSDGLSLTYFSDTFGSALTERLMELVQGYIERGTLVYDNSKQTIRLSRSGLFISDAIISDLFLEED